MSTTKNHRYTGGVGQFRMTAPLDRGMLALWVRAFCELQMPTHLPCPHHDSPLDYLAHAFFEGTEKGGLAHGDCVVHACRGGGKTQLGAVATLLDLLFKPGVQIRILGGSLEQSEKMYGYLRSMVMGHFADVLKGEPTQRGLRLANGSCVQVLPQSDRAVRGQRIQKLRCDEVELFWPHIWSAAQLTTRSVGSVGKGRHIQASIEALSTMHQPAGLMQRLMAEAAGKGRKVFSWCAWDVIERCGPERKCDGCALWDGCQGRAKHADGFLKIDDLIAMRGRVSVQTWDHEMLCEPPVHTDAVFPAFALAKHVRAFEWDADGRMLDGAGGKQEAAWICGVDFGFAGPFVCLWVAVVGTGSTAHVYVADEMLIERQRLDKNILAIARQAEKAGNPWPTVVYCDVAGTHQNSQTGQTDAQLLRDAGYETRYSYQAIAAGVGLIDSLVDPSMGEPRLTIHPRCKRLIAALQNYRWQPQERKPIKDGLHDHPLDALRYALCGHFGHGGKVTVRLY